MMRSPAGRCPFSRFIASPSRAKRSELEHDSFASTLPESIGGEVAAANMDGPDADSGTCCFGRPLILTPAQRVNGTDAFARSTHPSPSPVFQADSCIYTESLKL